MAPIRRKSAQRERIYQILLTSRDHPTALQVCEKLRKYFPDASLGNVYRNIRVLLEEGRIKSREFEDGVERFDAITDLHYHFICTKCDSITDFPMPPQKKIEELAGSISDKTILSHTIQFYGVCEKCNKQTKRKK